MQIFGTLPSPFVRKVHIVAIEKGVAFEAAAASGAKPTPDFLAASPFGKMPALRDGDFTLADSTAIATYLEALHPEPALLPADPRARARAVWFEELADTILAPACAKIAFNRFVAPRMMGRPGDEELARQGERDLAPVLDYLETQAPVGGSWLAGQDYSIGDIAVASMLMLLRYADWSFDAARHGAVAAWYGQVTGRPAWAMSAVREKETVAALLAKV